MHLVLRHHPYHMILQEHGYFLNLKLNNEKAHILINNINWTCFLITVASSLEHLMMRTWIIDRFDSFIVLVP